MRLNFSETLWWQICSSVLLVPLLPLVVTAVTNGCSGRVVLSETSGAISDGSGNYPASAHCEWLIDGKLTFYFGGRGNDVLLSVWTVITVGSWHPPIDTSPD